MLLYNLFRYTYTETSTIIIRVSVIFSSSWIALWEASRETSNRASYFVVYPLNGEKAEVVVAFEIAFHNLIHSLVSNTSKINESVYIIRSV